MISFGREDSITYLNKTRTNTFNTKMRKTPTLERVRRRRKRKKK